MKHGLTTKRLGSRCICSCAALLAVSTYAGCAQQAPEWPQWGGPNRDFRIQTEGLADVWPEDGPKQLWSRDLGDGYSTVVVDGDRLYTMYRTENDEFTIALDAKTGQTIWEHKNASPTTEQMKEFGPGPHSTPLIIGNRLYSVGTNALFSCFDKRSGKLLWARDLVKDLGAPIPGYGYACSPIAYKNTVILPVDRERPEDNGDQPSEGEEEDKTEPEKPTESQTLVAFDPVDGSVVWKAQDYPITYSSPILINFAGEDQLVYLVEGGMAGFNPDNGDLLWHQKFDQETSSLSSPLWNGKDLLFCSAAYGSGSRVIELTTENGKTVSKELWYGRKLRIHHGNAIFIDDYIYGSSGDFSSTLLVALNMRTGKVSWRERGFNKATFVYGGGKIVFLDEDGQLALATVTPEALTVHSKCKVTEPYSWAAPTLVGTKLYIRDRKKMMAFDLG